MPVTDHIRNKLSTVPHRPGVYLMKDRFGTVIYVGKARDLRKRVSQYFHPSRRQGWDLKFNALVDAIHDFDVHTVRSEPESLLLEGRLIKEFQPRYNISFRDDKRFLLLKINLNDPIPRFTLTRLKQDDGARYFGPFAHSAALRSTLTMIRRKFSLRGCRPLTPGEADYKHCLYANLKYCTAPCIGNVSRENYLLQVTAACDFLAGQSDELEAQLEDEMKKAAAALDFEKAAGLRDALEDLRRTMKKTEKFERLPYKLPLAINPDRDLLELAQALNLPKPPLRIEGFDISNISGTFAVSSMVSFKNGRPDRQNYRRFKMKTVTGQDDFACMAETVKRRYSRMVHEINSSPVGDDVRSRSPELKSKFPPQQHTSAKLTDILPANGEAKPLRRATRDLNELASTEFPDDATAEIEINTESLDNTSAETPASARAPHPAPIAASTLNPNSPEAPLDPLDNSTESVPHVEPESISQPPSASSSALSASSALKSSSLGKWSNVPDLILIDGGKGQLNAACAELAKLGLSHIPIIGLAKEFEEIYRPGESDPLRLDHNTGALKLLQRVRDESHRFANTYNAKLRLKKISESILDEFPGIGERRKAALLKKFGSIQRLRLATLEQIAEVPGFGGKAAAELKAFLDARPGS
ncbi:MAG TPA: excinuclease ABC subunit UvrC [Verrucomicrobiae bacterium]